MVEYSISAIFLEYNKLINIICNKLKIYAFKSYKLNNYFWKVNFIVKYQLYP